MDVTKTSQELGKTAGKDVEQQKATYPALFGIEESRRQAAAKLSEAHAALEEFGDGAARLREIADFIVHRSA